MSEHTYIHKGSLKEPVRFQVSSEAGISAQRHPPQWRLGSGSGSTQSAHWYKVLNVRCSHLPDHLLFPPLGKLKWSLRVRSISGHLKPFSWEQTRSIWFCNENSMLSQFIFIFKWREFDKSFGNWWLSDLKNTLKKYPAVDPLGPNTH